MKKEVLLGVGALALVGFGYLLGDYMRLREQATEGVAVRALESPDSAIETGEQVEPTQKPPIEKEPVLTTASKSPEFNSGFDGYPSRPFKGSPKPLRMTSDQRYYRTRLVEAYASPPDYGGSLVIEQIGCGTGCRTVYALDKSSGKVIDFPLGGEANMYLWIRYREDSSLIWATWEDSYPSDCKAQPWHLGASGFVPLSEPVGINCDVARDSN